MCLEPSWNCHNGMGLPGTRKDKWPCPCEAGRAGRPEHLPPPWQAPAAIPSRPTASPHSPAGVWPPRAVPALPGLHQPRFLPPVPCSCPVTTGIPAPRSAQPRQGRTRAGGWQGVPVPAVTPFPSPGKGQARGWSPTAAHRHVLSHHRHPTVGKPLLPVVVWPHTLPAAAPRRETGESHCSFLPWGLIGAYRKPLLRLQPLPRR